MLKCTTSKWKNPFVGDALFKLFGGRNGAETCVKSQFVNAVRHAN